MRRAVLALLLVSLTSIELSAQIPVTDPAVTLRNGVTAALKDYLVDLQRDQRRKLRRMARRLSMHTDLGKYLVLNPPRWRTHGGESFLYAGPYNNALIFGDPPGAAYLALSHPVSDARGLIGRLSPAARQLLMTRLATLDVADASEIAATNDAGQLRYNGRKQERPAIEALEADVIDPSLEQSATAVLDKISGAVLIGARQRQARAQLLADIVEQLLVESKRARDTDAAAMNMQLVTWRDGSPSNRAFAEGIGNALSTWRQP